MAFSRMQVSALIVTGHHEDRTSVFRQHRLIRGSDTLSRSSSFSAYYLDGWAAANGESAEQRNESKILFLQNDFKSFPVFLLITMEIRVGLRMFSSQLSYVGTNGREQ